MLMVTDFWAWKHVAQAPRACVASTRLWRGVDSRRCTCELEVDGARGWTDHLPWSHVEGGAGLRGYGVRIQRIEAYSAGKASDMQFGLEPSGLMEA